MRIALGIALALNVAFAGANLWLAPPLLGELLVFKLVQIAVLLGGLVLLWRRASGWLAPRVGELGLVVIIAMATLSELVAGGRHTVPILAVAVAMGAGAFIPLGMWGQVRLASMAALAVFANAWLLDGGLNSYPTVVALLGTAGSILVGREVSRNLTERRRIEEQLQASQKRYADLVDNAPDAILTLDGCGRLLTANPAAERLLGRRVDDLKGTTLFGRGLIAPRSRRAVVGIARALAAHGAAPPQEIVLLRGGRHVVVESNQRIVRAAGESIEVEVILRDLTEQRRAEEAARLRAFAAHLESVREDERGRLARSLHDDFAQSLAALGLQIGWLTRALPNELAEPNAKVREMGTLLSSMMQTVRQMTRELRPPVLDDFGLATAVHWETNDFRERTGIDCVMHIERDEAQDTDARVLAVFRTVQEALANVAARGATSVRVELDAGDSLIAVHIEDDGPALPSAALPWDIVCMRERAHLLGGSFEIESPAAGGMSLHLRVPREVSPA